MSAYIDTGVLAKLYCPESDSLKAINAVRRTKLPWVFTPWQRLELGNAMRLKLFRKEMTRRQMDVALGRIEEDLRSSLLVSSPTDTDALFIEAEKLSAQHTEHIGCRTLDILHVAAALVLQVDDFVTFDHRQGKAARKTGLRVIEAAER